MRHKKSGCIARYNHFCFCFVGVTRLELATSRPPDAYSNQLSYTPSFSKAMQSYDFYPGHPNISPKIFKNHVKFQEIFNFDLIVDNKINETTQKSIAKHGRNRVS